MNYIIRKMNRNDTKGVAHVIVTSWNETYKGIVPDSELDRLLENEDGLAQKKYDDYKDDNTTLVLEINKEIAGFVYYGEARDPELRECGEIYALYILKKYHGYGLGKKLVEKAIEKLKKCNYHKMVISCLKGNPSNEFYKHIGGKYLKDGFYERLSLPENVYIFDI